MKLKEEIHKEKLILLLMKSEMNYTFRKAETSDAGTIWDILKDAIRRRKEDGSNQWQDGYPNPDVVLSDIDKGYGYVLTEADKVIGYTAIMINDEPEYKNLTGEWLTNGDFVGYHRVAIAENYLGKGLARYMLEKIEVFAKSKNIYSIKADTNFDNKAMLRLFEKLGYVHCGEVVFRGSPRMAFEKVLEKEENLGEKI